jgi:hypothetical protein
MPGLPGSSSFVDAQDLACAFATAADAGPGEGEAYILGGTNETNLYMQQEMALLVGTAAPSRAAPAWVLRLLARWNECLLNYPCLWLRIKPDSIGSPWLVSYRQLLFGTFNFPLLSRRPPPHPTLLPPIQLSSPPSNSPSSPPPPSNSPPPPSNSPSSPSPPSNSPFPHPTASTIYIYICTLRFTR